MARSELCVLVNRHRGSGDSNLRWAEWRGPHDLKRNRTKPMTTFEERLTELAQKAKEAANKLPEGSKAREALLLRSAQLETTSRISKWLSSPEIRPFGAGENFLTDEKR